MRAPRAHQRVFFAAYGFGPYECFFCRDRSLSFEQMGNGTGCVHHINEDRENNHPYNLAPSHQACHNRWHNHQRKGVARSPEIQEHLRTINVGRKLTPEHREAISWSGRRHTRETRGKMAETRKTYWAEQPLARPPRPCEHCGDDFAPGDQQQRFCSRRCSNLGAPRGVAAALPRR